MLPMIVFDRPDTKVHERWDRVTRAHPLLLWWIAAWVLVIVAGAVVAANSSFRVTSFGGIIIVLGIAIGPLLAVVEREKFNEAATVDSDAI